MQRHSVTISEPIDVRTLEESASFIKCECGYLMPTLTAHTTWRKLKCVCDRVWYVKPSGRKFELPPRDLEY